MRIKFSDVSQWMLWFAIAFSLSCSAYVIVGSYLDAFSEVKK